MAIVQTRRSLLTGLGAALVAAPAIVRARSLMPVRMPGPRLITMDWYLREVLAPAAERCRRDRRLFHASVAAAIESGDETLIVKAMDPVGAALTDAGVLKKTVVGKSGFIEWRLPDHVIERPGT